MGLGPNYVLDKGLLATGVAAYKLGELVVLSGDGTKCAKAGAAAVGFVGVCYEDIDAAKVTTGKAVIEVRVLGIARVLAGAAVAVNNRVTTDATSRAINQAGAAGSGAPFFGIALTAATAAGQYIDVLLVPGGAV
jgi:hypothetical protein